MSSHTPAASPVELLIVLTLGALLYVGLCGIFG